MLVLGLGIATTTAFLEFLWVARTIFTAQNVSWNGTVGIQYTLLEIDCYFERKKEDNYSNFQGQMFNELSVSNQ